MSRAFLRDDAEGEMPRRHYDLPERDDPGYERAAARALGQGADEFLGTQGYVWDTQSDMWYALLGASSSLLLLARLHDREIARLGQRR